MELETLRDLFIHELKDLHSAEKQLVKALPKVAKAATNPDLKAGIEAHLEQTVEHVNRLEALLGELGETSRGQKCKAMEGLIEEGSDMISEGGDEDVVDAGIIAASQKIEHYEIAGYGTVRAYAEMLGEEEAVSVLQTTLDEEKETDVKLTELAMSVINAEANNEDDESENRIGKRGMRPKSTTSGTEAGDDDETTEESRPRARGSAMKPAKATTGGGSGRRR